MSRAEGDVGQEFELLVRLNFTIIYRVCTYFANDISIKTRQTEIKATSFMKCGEARELAPRDNSVIITV